MLLHLSDVLDLSTKRNVNLYRLLRRWRILLWEKQVERREPPLPQQRGQVTSVFISPRSLPLMLCHVSDPTQPFTQQNSLLHKLLSVEINVYNHYFMKSMILVVGIFWGFCIHLILMFSSWVRFLVISCLIILANLFKNKLTANYMNFKVGLSY